jgi:hypothetical protein
MQIIMIPFMLGFLVGYWGALALKSLLARI